MPAILILESDARQLEIYRDGLEAAGYSVISAASTPVGVEYLEDGGIDAVVVDHAILGGLKELHEALERLPDPPPFVLISGAVDAPTLSARMGAAAFLPGPCSNDDLARALARVCSPRGVPSLIEDDSPTSPYERH